MITQELKRKDRIASRRDGREWVFFLGESPDELLQSPGRAAPSTPLPKLNAAQFEDLARQVFSQRFGVPLRPGQVTGVPKLFDLVSPDGDIDRRRQVLHPGWRPASAAGEVLDHR